MDSKNLFHTRGTYLLMRMEHLSVVLVCSALAIANVNELDGLRFVIAFAVIDFVGYLPGAIVSRRRGPQIAPVYYYLYNITHCYLTWIPVIGLWAYLFDGFEWAMLAIPIHLSGDRSVFGNVFKPVSLPFEPSTALGINSPLSTSSAFQSKEERK